MSGQHHKFNDHKLQQTPGDSEGQGSLVCCSPWGCKEGSGTTQQQQQQKKLKSRIHILKEGQEFPKYGKIINIIYMNLYPFLIFYHKLKFCIKIFLQHHHEITRKIALTPTKINFNLSKFHGKVIFKKFMFVSFLFPLQKHSYSKTTYIRLIQFIKCYQNSA